MKKKMTYLFLVMITMTETLTTACISSDDEPATPVQKGTCTVGSLQAKRPFGPSAAVHSNLSKKTGSDTSYTWHLTT